MGCNLQALVEISVEVLVLGWRWKVEKGKKEKGHMAVEVNYDEVKWNVQARSERVWCGP
jgi:hypothetical protein